MLSIVIPCLNEKETIKRVIIDAHKHAQKNFGKSYELIVADNGSTDGTLQILTKLNKLKVINVPIRGYGAALHWGIMHAKGEYVVFGDADLSYPFSNLEKFKPLLVKKPDMILGSRLKGSIEKDAMPWLHQYVGTPLLTLLIRLIYKIPVTDCNSGMRMIRRAFYKNLNMRNSGMEWASELLLKTALKKGKYMEVPIKFLKDKRNRKPHLSTWSDGWRHLKAIMLLKPSSLYPMIIINILLAIVAYPTSFAAAFLFLDVSYILILSILTVRLLHAAIDGEDNKVSKYLKRFEIVPLGIGFAILVVLATVAVPEERLGTKLFLVSLFGITFMWVFLVETIKTHLVNRLPDLNTL